MTLKHIDFDPFRSGRYKMVSEHTLTVGRDHLEKPQDTLLYSFLTLLYFYTIDVGPKEQVHSTG